MTRLLTCVNEHCLKHLQHNGLRDKMHASVSVFIVSIVHLDVISHECCVVCGNRFKKFDHRIEHGFGFYFAFSKQPMTTFNYMSHNSTWETFNYCNEL